MRVVAIANQKGGCGKTTTSINLAAALAFLQKKTLLIDLDPQGHSTCGLGIKAENIAFTIYDVLSPQRNGVTGLEEIMLPLNEFLSLAPADGGLGRVEDELADMPGRELRLHALTQRFRQQVPEIEYVILDCPPNLGAITANALMAADEVIIPIEPSFFSLHGLAKISETMQAINRKRKTAAAIHALLTLFDSRTSFAKEVYEEVRKHFKHRLFKTIIHECVALKEAAGAGQSIVQYDRNSVAFRDYFNLAVEYLERQWELAMPQRKLGWQQVIGYHFGPRPAMGGVLFQMMSKTARSVEIAGDFNQWVPESLVRRSAEGLWQKIIPITGGSYRYKFIVDGEGQIDPYQPVQRPNAFGSWDSYLEVAHHE